MLKGLFVPRDGFWDEQVSSIRSEFDTRLPFVSQCMDLISSVATGAFQPASNYPVFSFDYKGATYNIFDFSVVAQYRGLIHALVLFFSYYLFVRRLLHRLPAIIGSIPDTPTGGAVPPGVTVWEQSSFDKIE